MLSRHLPTASNRALGDVRAMRAVARKLACPHGLTLPLASALRVPQRTNTTTASGSALHKLLLPNDQFAPRHLGPSEEQVKEMCEAIKVKDVQQLIEQTIPAAVR